ncbi:MAG: DUF445 domain-containing protein [Clostridiales Family XIII bacterium]|jgi:uncharacterized membrane protein YheB (UPF0754 family)|nr:DUF445 domain-containing protein [Clostridiales Family XIII bacterium]
MLFSVLKLIFSTGLGGATGYITNVIAIKMLFKKYWKWGGYIADNYEDFIQNMSELVEKDLVNGETLTEEFDSPEFKEAFQIWIADIIIKKLPENSGAIHFGQIPGIEKSVEHIILLLENISVPPVQGIYKMLGNQKIGDVLSEEQYHYIVDTIRNVFEDAGDYEEKIQNTLALFFQGKLLKTLISERAARQLERNIRDSIEKIDVAHFDKKIEITYRELLNVIEIDSLIFDLQQTLGSMRFADLVHETRHLSRKITTQIVEFADSEEGRHLLSEIIDSFLSEAGHIDLKIEDIVSPSVKDGIIGFCKEKMPVIIDKISDFIKDTQKEIEEIVNRTVDKQLDSNGFGKFLKFIKDILTDNLSASLDVVGVIIKGVKEHGGKSGDELSLKILDLFETKTIGEMVQSLQGLKVVSINSFVDLINANLKSLPKDYGFIDKFLQRPMKDSLGNIDLSIIETAFFPKIFDYVKREYLYTDQFKRDVRSAIESKTSEIFDKPISGLFDVSKIKIKLNAEKMKSGLLNLYGTFSAMKISDVIGVEAPKQLRIKRELFESFWRNNREHELNQLYNAMQNGAVYTKIADGITEVVNQNRDAILKEHVKTLVYNNLIKLQPHKISDMVENFIGKELKPINIIGAVLGAIVGFASSPLASSLSLPHPVLLAVYFACFAFVGMATNKGAITMLFRPYANKLPKCPFFNKSPFVGVVVARKPRLANDISSFIKDRMLSDSDLKNQLFDNKESIKEKCFQWASNSKYALIGSLFADKERREGISNFIFTSIQKSIVGHGVEVSNFICDFVKRIVSDGKLHDLLPALRDGLVKKLKASDLASIAYNFIKKETEGKKLSSYRKAIDLFANSHMKKLFETSARNLSQDISLCNLKKLISGHNEDFMAYIAKHTAVDLIGSSALDNATRKISKQIPALLHTAIAPIISQLEKQELHPDKKIREFCGGAIPEFVEKKVSSIIDALCCKLGEQKSDISAAVMKKTPILKPLLKKQLIPIIDTLIDEELPQFLHGKKCLILKILDGLLETRLSALGFNSHSLKVENLECAITGILGSPHVKMAVERFVIIIVHYLTQLPIKTLLRFIGINNINDVIELAEPLLSVALSHVKKHLSKDEVIDVLEKQGKSILLDILDEIPANELLKNIETEKELHGIVTLLVNDQTVLREISNMIEAVLFAVQKDPAFYNDTILRKDTAGFIVLLEQKRGWDILRPTMVSALEKFLLNINAKITDETKNAICNAYLIPAIVDSCVDNFDSIIKAIDVEKAIEREINGMEPKKIEGFFRGFADKYFKKIIFYGWIGGFFGLASYALGCLLAIFMK